MLINQKAFFFESSPNSTARVRRKPLIWRWGTLCAKLTMQQDVWSPENAYSSKYNALLPILPNALLSSAHFDVYWTIVRLYVNSNHQSFTNVWRCQMFMRPQHENGTTNATWTTNREDKRNLRTILLANDMRKKKGSDVCADTSEFQPPLSIWPVFLLEVIL